MRYSRCESGMVGCTVDEMNLARQVRCMFNSLWIVNFFQRDTLLVAGDFLFFIEGYVNEVFMMSHLD